MTDRAMQALWLLALDPVAEVTADRNSYGFRKERSCADAIEQCFNLLARRCSPQWVLEGDIKACFDRVSHTWLLEHVPLPKQGRDRGAQWLRAGYMERGALHPTEEGTPQGGIISPVLANLALDGLERILRQRYPHRGRHSSQHKVNLVRYADDFVITGSSKELLETEVLPLVSNFMTERGLELSAEKTVITHMEDGFDFLGQNLRKYGGKLIIKPSDTNVKTFLDTIREIVKTNKATAAGALIRQLNPKIRGWANYHRHVCSAKTFQRVDRALFEMLWRWATRRHRNKSRRWIKDKYFTYIPGPLGGDHWRFFGMVQRADGAAQSVILCKAGQTRIRRHTKIREQVNPYHPQWQKYLRSRHARRRRAKPEDDAGESATVAPTFSSTASLPTPDTVNAASLTGR